MDGKDDSKGLDRKQPAEDWTHLVDLIPEFIPYATQSIDESDVAALREVLLSGWLTQGPSVPVFESQFSLRHNVGNAIAVSNATAGLHLACLSLGVGPGQIVWTSPISFVASANCALYCGASIDFVDIDVRTRNMCPKALARKLEEAEVEGKLPSVVIPVHFAGLPCDMSEIKRLSLRYGFKIIEDASHAVGAELDGCPVSSQYSDAAVFSFHPVKIITTGEGGMVVTHDNALAERIRLLRSHGITRDIEHMEEQHSCEDAWYYEQISLGFNYRMTDIQAALGISQLKRLEQFHTARTRIAKQYERLLADLPFKLPTENKNSISSWHLYVVELSAGEARFDRASVFKHMRQAGIGVNVHYIPIHLQPYYRRLGFKPGQFLNAETYYENAISIPLYPRLTDAQQVRVVTELKRSIQL